MPERRPADGRRAAGRPGTLSRDEKRDLLDRLPHVEAAEVDTTDVRELQSLSLGPALRLLAEIDHERLYLLCRSVAQHLLERVPEPEDVELDT